MDISISDVRKKYPGYDDLSDNEIADKLHAKFYSDMPKEQFYSKIGLSSSQELSSENKPNRKDLEDKVLGSSILGSLGSDILGGALKGGQNISALLGEAGQQLGSLAEPLRKYVPESMKRIPDVNIREEMGLGKEIPVDIAKLISPHGSEFTQNVSQYLPGVISGGASIPGQMVSNALYNATQASPEQENLFGALPEGRSGAMIEGAMVPGAFGLASKAGSVASKLNPLRFTDKNIIKNILETKTKMQDKYSGMYKDLWKKAHEKGLGGELINKPEINYKIIEKYTPSKKISGLQDFKENPTLDNAHHAKSDLLAIQRELDKKVTHNKAERKQNNAVSKAINNIQDNMFSTKEGKVDTDLLNQYKKVQTGYKNDVVPYKNKHINQYKSKEITQKQLIEALSKGPFAAKVGERHLIGTRENLSKALKAAGITGLGLGGLGYGVKTYYGLKNQRNID